MQWLTPEFTHSDSRRTISQMLTEPIAQVNTYFIKKGSTLGNHYHKVTKEYFFVIEGELYMDIQPLGEKETKGSVLSTGDFFLVEPLEVHKVEAITDVRLMTLLTKAFTEEDPDIHV